MKGAAGAAAVAVAVAAAAGAALLPAAAAAAASLLRRRGDAAARAAHLEEAVECSLLRGRGRWYMGGGGGRLGAVCMYACCRPICRREVTANGAHF